jgi:hypothetical protein
MEEWKRIINEIFTRLEKLETNTNLKEVTIPEDGYIIPKRIASDPVSPVEGEIWINTTSNTLKVRINGVTKTVTLT